MSRFAELAEATYVSIESSRPDGSTVRTPVWITSEGEKLYCWTMADSGKVKRIRNNPRVMLARCDAMGNLQGDAVPALAKALDSPADVRQQTKRMSKRFGLKFFFFRLLPRLRGTSAVAIEFAPA